MAEAVSTSLSDGGEHFEPIPISIVARFMGIWNTIMFFSLTNIMHVPLESQAICLR